MPKLLSVKPANDGKHKYIATFLMPNGREKSTRFGAVGYSDYRQHRSEERKISYLKRHERRETWSDPTTAGSLSRWLLWGEPTLEASIKKFKQKFNL